MVTATEDIGAWTSAMAGAKPPSRQECSMRETGQMIRHMGKSTSSEEHTFPIFHMLQNIQAVIAE